MTASTLHGRIWEQRAAERSPSVQRSRDRTVEQAGVVVAAARRLLERDDAKFTTQELIKEAGVALQTFYRYFSGKDELLLAVFEESVVDGCRALRAAAADLPDPLDRLKVYVTGTIRALETATPVASRFMTAEHYRLHQVFPDELAQATRPFADLLVPEIEAASALGELAPPNGAVDDAWLASQLAMSTFHHYAFASREEESVEVLAERLWSFCLAALGGRSEAGTGPEARA